MVLFRSFKACDLNIQVEKGNDFMNVTKNEEQTDPGNIENDGTSSKPLYLLIAIYAVIVMVSFLLRIVFQ